MTTTGNRQRRSLRHAITACGLALAVSNASGAVPTSPNSMIVFGDSYSDPGNAFALTGGTYPYPSGRFSDGPVWVERLASAYGLSANPVYAQFPLPPTLVELHTNFAIGGAQIGNGNSGDTSAGYAFGFATGISAQKDTFLANIPVLEGVYGLPSGSLATDVFPQSLFVVHAAGNDYRRWSNLSDPAELQAVVADSITAFGTVLSDLHQGAGAQHFLVPNMPGYAEFDDPFVGTVETFREFAAAFNTALAPRLAELRDDLGVNIVEVDFFDLFNRIAADPAAFGLANVGTPCVDFNAFLGVEGVCSNPDTTLMWDSLHPTTATHALLADAAHAALAPIPLPPAVWLFGSALLGLGLRRRSGHAVTAP